MKEREPFDDEGAAGHGERRSPHRVADNQHSGHGAITALSKLKMMERRNRIVRRPRDDDVGEGSPAK
jgi:hypothetical protein